MIALGPIHGYGISQRIRQISKEVLQVQQGSLYPALHRLEQRGWLSIGADRRLLAHVDWFRIADKSPVDLLMRGKNTIRKLVTKWPYPDLLNKPRMRAIFH